MTNNSNRGQDPPTAEEALARDVKPTRRTTTRKKRANEKRSRTTSTSVSQDAPEDTHRRSSRAAAKSAQFRESRKAREASTAAAKASDEDRKRTADEIQDSNPPAASVDPSISRGVSSRPSGDDVNPGALAVDGNRSSNAADDSLAGEPAETAASTTGVHEVVAELVTDRQTDLEAQLNDIQRERDNVHRELEEARREREQALALLQQAGMAANVTVAAMGEQLATQPPTRSSDEKENKPQQPDHSETSNGKQVFRWIAIGACVFCVIVVGLAIVLALVLPDVLESSPSSSATANQGDDHSSDAGPPIGTLFPTTTQTRGPAASPVNRIPTEPPSPTSQNLPAVPTVDDEPTIAPVFKEADNPSEETLSTSAPVAPQDDSTTDDQDTNPFLFINNPTAAPNGTPVRPPTPSPTRPPTMPPSHSQTDGDGSLSGSTIAPTRLPTGAPTLFPTRSPTHAPTSVSIADPQCSTEAFDRCVNENVRAFSQSTCREFCFSRALANGCDNSFCATYVDCNAVCAPCLTDAADYANCASGCQLDCSTAKPTSSPTDPPTTAPTSSPTTRITLTPTELPTKSPTATPTASPSAPPTPSPTGTPTAAPAINIRFLTREELIEAILEYLIQRNIGVRRREERNLEDNQLYPDMNTWDVSLVTDMHELFYAGDNPRLAEFNEDISAWDVSRVTDMNAMFKYASAFNQDLSGWQVGRVTDMGLMFYAASDFNQNLCSWELKLPNEFYAYNAFMETSCPDESSPNHWADPVGSFCHACQSYP